MSKASNRIHCDDFVWFPSTTRSVLGISSMEFYLHTNRAVRHSLWPKKARKRSLEGAHACCRVPRRVHALQATSVPNTLADCARLVQERNDALAKVWIEGIVTVSNNMLVRSLF